MKAIIIFGLALVIGGISPAWADQADAYESMRKFCVGKRVESIYKKIHEEDFTLPERVSLENFIAARARWPEIDYWSAQLATVKPLTSAEIIAGATSVSEIKRCLAQAIREMNR